MPMIVEDCQAMRAAYTLAQATGIEYLTALAIVQSEER